MQDRLIIQNYVNNFRRHLSTYLKPGIGLSSKIYSTTSEGAVLEFTIGPGIANDDNFESTLESVNKVLKVIPQRFVGGNIDGIRFGGTNISMEANRILIIKGEDATNLWSDESALNDVKRILGSHAKAQR